MLLCPQLQLKTAAALIQETSIISTLKPRYQGPLSEPHFCLIYLLTFSTCYSQKTTDPGKTDEVESGSINIIYLFVKLGPV